jgi:glycosyltransferase involved in cell wall biosynthesis
MTVAVAACIITYRRPRGLEKLLDHLRRQEGLDQHPLVVVVVDNDPAGSARPVVDAAQRRGLNVVYGHEPVPGIPRARNRSVELALGRRPSHLCFLDDDEFPAADWLARLLAHAASSGAPVVSGPVLSILPDGAPRWLERSRVFSRRRYPTGDRRDQAATNNVLVRRDVFETIDRWFDESMPLTGGTDAELFRRVHAAGFAIEWCDEALVYEDVPPERCSLRWIGRRSLRQGLDIARLARRYGGALAVARVLKRGSICIARAVLYVATLGLTPGLRLRMVEQATFGAGLLLGALGVTIDEYRRPSPAPLS